MYQASNDFHAAVKNGNHQMPLLIFSDTVFTQSDIDVDAGIEFDDNFNLEEDLAIGQATANEIRFTLFNDDRLLNKYGFGEFVATIGVHIGTDTYKQYAPIVLNTNYAQYYGHSMRPYLRRNGTSVSSQPEFPVKSILGYDGKVWAFGDDGQYAVYNDQTGANVTAQNPVNAFMRNKSIGWAGKGLFYNHSSRILFIYEAGQRERYEFVPLGTFIAKRPKVPDQIRISMTCHDRMTKLDEDVPDLGPFPCTLGQLFVRICNVANVPYRTSTFINSGTEIKKKPDDFDSVTLRTVMGWIAEAAGSNARFDRDGYLIMDWLRDTGQAYSEGDYTDFLPTWYETQKIGKLHIRNTYDGKESTVGSGKIGYLIQDNPFLK